MHDTPTPIGRVSVQTLGCKLNFAETSEILSQFLTRGYSYGGLDARTSIFVLNTCSVTREAERECRQVIRRVRKLAPEAFVAVTGCYAQLRPEEIASIDGVDAVLGAAEKFQLFSRFESFEKCPTPQVLVGEIGEAHQFDLASSTFESGRTRAFLKLQDGCDYTCAFCTIPKARGESRSGSPEAILAEARKLSSQGFLEIVLSGVNVGDFGRKSGTSLAELLQLIESDAAIQSRIRISSIEPNLLSAEIIELARIGKKICPHFHIPLQSGSPAVLRRMQRRYSVEQYRSRVEAILCAMPDAAIGVDVIVGFPGETDDEFEETYSFLLGLDIAYLHVFTYSERPGTRAGDMGSVVPQKIRKDRNTMLRILSEKKRRQFMTRQRGQVVQVLLERPSGTCAVLNSVEPHEGYSENYVRVRICGEVPDEAALVDARLGETIGDLVFGELVRVRAYGNTSNPSEHLLLPIIPALTAK